MSSTTAQNLFLYMPFKAEPELSYPRGGIITATYNTYNISNY